MAKATRKAEVEAEARITTTATRLLVVTARSPTQDNYLPFMNVSRCRWPFDATSGGDAARGVGTGR